MADWSGGAGAGAPSPFTSDVPPVVDWERYWRSPEFLKEADEWTNRTLPELGLRRSGQFRTHRVRFWATVLHVDTDYGRVWFKATNPGQAFEPSALATLSRLAPRDFLKPLAIREERGWMLLPDGGSNLREMGGTEAAWSSLVAQVARVQAQLSAHERELVQPGGVTVFGPDHAANYVRTLVDSLAALPPNHGQALSRRDARRFLDDLRRTEPLFRELAASGIPMSFQPNDVSLSNAFAGPGQRQRYRLFDVGDAFWSHPLAALHVPIRMATGSWPGKPAEHHPMVARLRSASLRAWRGQLAGARAPEVRRLVDAADRLGALHRCESWRRLLAHVPHDAVSDPPRLSFWLAQAVAMEP